jgi:hypothetical protein
MTHRSGSHSVPHWHLPHWQAPPLPGLPRLHLRPRHLAAWRRVLIVALTTLLAGSLTYHLHGAPRGPYAPTSTAAATRA